MKAPMITEARESLSIVIVGHDDSGKSTMVGRLLHETGSLPDGRYESIRDTCAQRGVPIEWALLTDECGRDRDQDTTSDNAHFGIHSQKRGYDLIDAPGEHEVVSKMMTGVANADAALLLIDAADGVGEETRRYGYLLHMLGIDQVIVLINKIDQIGHDRARNAAIETEYRAYLTDLGMVPLCVIPVSAQEGDNLVAQSALTPWYDGPILVDALDQFEPATLATELPLRLPVHDVRKHDDREIIAGRIEAGFLRPDDKVLFSPSNKTAHIATLEASRSDASLEAQAGDWVDLTLDVPLSVERGEIISRLDDPPIESDVVRAKVFWVAAADLRVGDRFGFALNTSEATVTVQSIESVIDPISLNTGAGERVSQNDVAEVVLRADRMLALDSYVDCRGTGRFALMRDDQIAGGGTLSMEGYPDQRALVSVKATNITAVGDAVGAEERTRRNRHRGGVLWFTGLSGAGKSTIAQAVDKALFARGYQVYVLDGDNVRGGLNANLGFSPEDRAENIRRVGEAAALFADAGMLVVTAFISPYRADRDRARAAAERLTGAHSFVEVFIDADLATCESRDPKGLYRRARAGEISDFTGISAPYEPPDAPDLVVDTADQSIDACVETIVGHVDRHFAIQP